MQYEPTSHRFPWIEVYETRTSLNVSFMREIFISRTTNRNFSEKFKLDLNIPRRNQAIFGTKIHKFHGRKIRKRFTTRNYIC